jgi:CubicO group peptidase (beta-lactamase class C family)
MSILDEIIAGGVERQDMPCVVATVVDSKGVLWEGSAGRANAQHAAGPETVFRLWSMTKAIGSIAAMIMVERGAMSLETPVGDVVPGFDELQVCESIGPDGPVFRQPRRRATLRHLLTHTSGLAYAAFDQKMLDYQTAFPEPDHTSGKLSGFNYPLMFDPGEGFTYGIGVDWACRMVQCLDGRTIDRFVTDEIMSPLEMENSFFEVDTVRERLVDAVQRQPDGYVPMAASPPSNPEFYGMGHSMYGTASDYAKMTRLVLNKGVFGEHRVFGDEAYQLLTTSQIGGQLIPNPIVSCIPSVSADIELLDGLPMTATAGFFRNEAAAPGKRSAGSLTWGGYMNTHYWIDPEKNVAAVVMSQFCPFYDPPFMAVLDQFERQVYNLYRP